MLLCDLAASARSGVASRFQRPQVPVSHEAFRACLRSLEQEPEECQVDHLQAGVQFALAVLP